MISTSYSRALKDNPGLVRRKTVNGRIDVHGPPGELSH